MQSWTDDCIYNTWTNDCLFAHVKQILGSSTHGCSNCDRNYNTRSSEA